MYLTPAYQQILLVSNFHDLVSTPFNETINAICWSRKLNGDFSEIIRKVDLNENIVVLDEEVLRALSLSEQGALAREILINDLKLLTAHGADPVLNLITSYERDDTCSLFPTDVYSYHVDRSPVPTDTFLCTYYGESSEILSNAEAQQKILVPEIREELKNLYGKNDEGFESYLIENFYDLHYQAKNNASPISLGLGNLCRLAVDYPESKIPPCIHRAPKEKTTRLLLIC